MASRLATPMYCWTSWPRKRIATVWGWDRHLVSLGCTKSCSNHSKCLSATICNCRLDKSILFFTSWLGQAADRNDHRVSDPCATFSCHEVIGTLMFIHMPWLHHNQPGSTANENEDMSCLHEKGPKRNEELRETQGACFFSQKTWVKLTMIILEND